MIDVIDNSFKTALHFLEIGDACARKAWDGSKFVIMKSGVLFLVEKTNDDLRVVFKALDNISSEDILAEDWIWRDKEPFQPFVFILDEFINGKSVVQVDPFIPRNKWHIIHPNPIIRHIDPNKAEALLKGSIIDDYSYWITFGGKNIYEEDLEEEPLLKKRMKEDDNEV